MTASGNGQTVSKRNKFISAIYATHNRSSRIREALSSCLRHLGPGARGLEIGAGSTSLHPAIVKLDLVASANIDVCADAHNLPFPDNVFDVVICQEVLEHVHDPFQATREMRRVLKPDGLLYCQAPFIIGLHSLPHDYWRFTARGIRQVVEQAGLHCREVRVAVGAGTGSYRVVVEFIATLAARMSGTFYLPAKGFFGVCLYPLKWLDRILCEGPQADRIPGGYYVIATPRTPAEEGTPELARRQKIPA